MQGKAPYLDFVLGLDEVLRVEIPIRPHGFVQILFGFLSFIFLFVTL